MLKKLIASGLSILLLFASGCARSTPVQNNTTGAEQLQGSVHEEEWDAYSDHELMEMTMESEQIGFRQLSAVHMTAEEWKEYMLEHCEPFQILMLRDTTLESLEAHTAALVEQYKGMAAENFVLLVQTVHPEMKDQLQDYEITFPPRTGAEEVIVQ